MNSRSKTVIKETSLEGISIYIECDSLRGTISFSKDQENIGHAEYKIGENFVSIEKMNINNPYNKIGLQQKAMRLLKNTYGISEFHC